jgi:hypothetical protein
VFILRVITQFDGSQTVDEPIGTILLNAYNHDFSPLYCMELYTPQGEFQLSEVCRYLISLGGTAAWAGLGSLTEPLTKEQVCTGHYSGRL